MNVLITGDSHVSSLRRGQTALGRGKNHKNLYNLSIQPLACGEYLSVPFFVQDGDYAFMTNDVCRQRFKRMPPEGHNYDWIGISGPFHSSRIDRGVRHWRMFSPWQMSNGKMAVSTAMLRQGIESDVVNILDFIDVVRATVPVFVIESPWPFKHSPVVSKMGVELVHFLHQQYRGYVLGELGRRSIPVVDINPTWIDADGFMDQQFRHENPKDRHHGNAKFGQLMLERITSFLEEA
jgi:hypothetical protein